jgi:4-hydroxybenzoate polyprenyltransferase
MGNNTPPMNPSKRDERVSPAVGARSAFLKLEALWWQSRIGHAAPIYLVAIAGWLIGRGSRGADSLRLAMFLLSLALLTGALALVNGVMDEEEDRATAPIGPLLTGLLTRREVIVGTSALVAAGLPAVAVAAASPIRFVAALLLLVVAGCLTVAYSLIKGRGALASGAMASVWVVAAAAGWVISAPSGITVNVFLVAGYAFLAGFADNVVGGLFDVETDPRVGNLTVAVRLGPARAFRATALLDSATFAVVAATALRADSPGARAAGLALAGIAAAWMAVSLRGVARALAGARGRTARMTALRPYLAGTSLRDAALVCALSLPIGLAVAIPLWLLQRASAIVGRRRVAGGGMRRLDERLRRGRRRVDLGASGG